MVVVQVVVFQAVFRPICDARVTGISPSSIACPRPYTRRMWVVAGEKERWEDFFWLWEGRSHAQPDSSRDESDKCVPDLRS